MNKTPLFFILILLCSLNAIDVHHWCMSSDRIRDCSRERTVPVCGWFNSNVPCYVYPCAARFSNVCSACTIQEVEKVTLGRCQ